MDNHQRAIWYFIYKYNLLESFDFQFFHNQDEFIGFLFGITENKNMIDAK